MVEMKRGAVSVMVPTKSTTNHARSGDEVGHVEIGTRWFHYLCAERNLEPEPTFCGLFEEYMGGAGKGRAAGPLQRDARLAAGFSENELAFLEGK